MIHRNNSSLNTIKKKYVKNVYILHRTQIIPEFNNEMIMILINPLKCFFGIEGHVTLDRNLGPGYNTLLL